jgi:hypothetical protein
LDRKLPISSTDSLSQSKTSNQTISRATVAPVTCLHRIYQRGPPHGKPAMKLMTFPNHSSNTTDGDLRWEIFIPLLNTIVHAY